MPGTRPGMTNMAGIARLPRNLQCCAAALNGHRDKKLDRPDQNAWRLPKLPAFVMAEGSRCNVQIVP
jgi:hypothetical protein